MPEVLKTTVEFKKREIEGGNTGKATFFLRNRPEYLPEENQIVLVTHTNVDQSTGLSRKLSTRSSNTVEARFVRFIKDEQNTDVNNGFTNFLELEYIDSDFGTNLGFGDCFGKIEYDVDPEGFGVLKPIENSTIVTDTVPFNGTDGKAQLSAETGVNEQFQFFLTNRTTLSSDTSNLFSSFGLPITSEQKKKYDQSNLGELSADNNGDLIINGVNYNWSSSGNQDVLHPVTGYSGQFHDTALQDFNQDKILVFNIPQGEYGEIIDGKTIKLTVPTGSSSSVEIYSAFKRNDLFLDENRFENAFSEIDYIASEYGTGVITSDEAGHYESNVVFLFSDAIQKPTSGISWSDGHSAAFSGNTSVYSKAQHQNSGGNVKNFFDFFNDKAVGIAYLDKGFIVITDPTIIADFETHYGNSSISSFGTPAKETFDSGQNMPKIEFLSYNTEKSLNVVCLSSTDEFYRTTNETAKALVGKTDKSFADFKNDFSSDKLKPIKITEIGLHDEEGNLLAVAKPEKPIEKYWYEVESFQIQIKL